MEPVRRIVGIRGRSSEGMEEEDWGQGGRLAVYLAANSSILSGVGGTRVNTKKTR